WKPLPQLVPVPNEAIASGTIDHVSGTDDRVTVSKMERYSFVIEFKGVHGRLLAHVASRGSGMIEEDFIKFRPENLVRRCTFGVQTVPKIESDPLAARGDNFASIFNQKSARIDFWFHSHPFKRIETGREHRLTNAKPRKLFLIEDHHASACLGEKRACRASRRTSTDDCYIECLGHAYEKYHGCEEPLSSSSCMARGPLRP